MIKITKHLYIHSLTVVLFAVCYITRRLELLFMSYMIMTVHELSHLLAAVCIGLKPSRIVFYPFGVNLKLKNRIIYSVSDEVILYFAGPLSNIIMALAAVFSDFSMSEEFYLQNIALFILNMLPIVPLDGGIIMKKTLGRLCGYKKAERIMKGVSIVLTVMFSAFGIYLAVINKFNYSVIFLAVFLISNIFTASEKYNIDFVNELIFYKEKTGTGERVRAIVAREDADFKKIAAKFRLGCYYLVFLLDNDGKILRTMTETEIMNSITGT